MTTQAPWADRDILDRLRGCGGDPSSEDIADAIAEIERLRVVGELCTRKCGVDR